jgi:hypothetical protein
MSKELSFDDKSGFSRTLGISGADPNEKTKPLATKHLLAAALFGTIMQAMQAGGCLEHIELL